MPLLIGGKRYKIVLLSMFLYQHPDQTMIIRNFFSSGKGSDLLFISAPFNKSSNMRRVMK